MQICPPLALQPAPTRVMNDRPVKLARGCSPTRDEWRPSCAMNWAAREREKREVNGGPRTRKEWTTGRAPEKGQYPAGLIGRAERA